MQVILGVDGGGSQTRSLLVNQHGECIGRGLAGSSNINHCGAATLESHLGSAVAQALAGIDTSELNLQAACFGLAGVSAPEAYQQVTAVIHKLALPCPAPAALVNDAHIALTGGLAGAAGMVLLAGTGSVCLAVDANGKRHRTGGWGSIADDGGSAGWIGRQAIEAAVRQADGRLPGQRLKEAIFTRLNLHSVDELVQRLHHQPIAWSEIAALCPTVIQLATSGDPIAAQIVSRALDELVALVDATARKLDQQPLPLVLIGGLIDHANYLTQRLTRQLRATAPQLTIQPPCLPPVAGAVLHALQAQQKPISAAFLARLQASLRARA